MGSEFFCNGCDEGKCSKVMHEAKGQCAHCNDRVEVGLLLTNQQHAIAKNKIFIQSVVGPINVKVPK